MMSEWYFPHDVSGWMTPGEGRKLGELAAGRTVLELGSWCGRSTVCMAQTANHVHSLDWHRGDRGTGSKSTLDEFLYNLIKHRVRDKVIIHVGKVEDIAPHLAPGSFDLVFIDTAHDGMTVQRDLATALRLVRRGGTIAFHDWNYHDVRDAATEWMQREPTTVLGSLAWYDIPVRPASQASVFVALPCYDGVAPQALEGLILATANAKYTLQTGCGSLLALVFNRLWVGALNSREVHGWSHFAMHHSDIEASPGWLDTLLDEQAKTGADVLSVVVPIKDGRGVTSTGLRSKDGHIRRLTLKEVHKLPETFDAQMAGAKEGEHLVCNTGLWICDFTKPWVEDICFNICDGIKKHEDGVFRAHTLPEDWNFSRMLHAKGLKVLATRKVAVGHHGKGCYRNDSPWGDFETDLGDG